MAETGIEWTDRSWNPIVGCSIISPGCTNCYAMKMAGRIERMGTGAHYAGTTRDSKAGSVWTGKLALAPENVLLAPLRRRKPTTWFVNSMGDLFHEDVPDAWIDRVFAVMALAPQHTFQVLTKRAARMRAYLTKPVSGPWAGRAFSIGDDGVKRDMTDVRMRMMHALCEQLPRTPAKQLNLASELNEPHGDGFMPRWPLPNVWLGVSAEDQQRADERVPDLLATPAAVRFVSAEPLLGTVNLRSLWTHCPTHDFAGGFCIGHCPDRNRLDWVIVGGESGRGARPMQDAWADDIRRQCEATGTAFFMKQMGGPVKARMRPIPDHLMVRQMPAVAHG